MMYKPDSKKTYVGLHGKKNYRRIEVIGHLTEVDVYVLHSSVDPRFNIHSPT
jgi:hypothetical protein